MWQKTFVEDKGQNESIELPLLTVDNFSGILIIPTKSSVGTRDRRIDLIRIASPFPL